jgi:hypothetical protein
MIDINDAYDILMNIIHNKKKLYEIDKKTLDVNCIKKILNYNYSWTIILLNYKIHVDLIKKVLNEAIDFYILELLYINRKIQNEFVSYELVKLDIKNTAQQKNIYYKLTAVKIPHDISHLLCKMSDLDIDKIIDIAMMGFNDVRNLIKANVFDEHQMEFLRLSKLSYINFYEFSKVKQTIFDNAIRNNLITDDELLHRQYGLIIEPSAKKQKQNN